ATSRSQKPARIAVSLSPANPASAIQAEISAISSLLILSSLYQVPTERDCTLAFSGGRLCQVSFLLRFQAGAPFKCSIKRKGFNFSRARVCENCLTRQSKQSFPFELLDNAVVDQIFGFETTEFFIGESQYADGVADTLGVGINPPRVHFAHEIV